MIDDSGCELANIQIVKGLARKNMSMISIVLHIILTVELLFIFYKCNTELTIIELE